MSTSEVVQEIWLVRHGETEWSRDRRHTSSTDLPLTSVGEAAARELAPRLAAQEFDAVFASPLRRARDTAELAGFPDPEVLDELTEWAYGDYEGITTEQIREQVEDWTIWTHPVPGGESAAQVAARLDRALERLRAVPGRSLVFAHGHSLRALTARWLDCDVSAGRYYRLDTARISILTYERSQPVIGRWNG